MAIDQESFRDLMTRWASGITVVTCCQEGRAHGMTANSFTSLSLNPPLVLICVGKGKLTNALIYEQRSFGIHILDSTMQELSDRCAGFRGEEAHWLDDVPAHAEVTGAPILNESLGWMDCTLREALDGGDHTIFIGEIQAAGSREGEPLLWYRRGYHTLAEP